VNIWVAAEAAVLYNTTEQDLKILLNLGWNLKFLSIKPNKKTRLSFSDSPVK